MRFVHDTPLHREPLPARLRLSGEDYALERPLKVDTWAASYLVRDSRGARHVLKIARLRPTFLPGLAIPLGVQTTHEVALYRQLAGIPGIPALTGRPSSFAFLHAFVPGRELRRRERTAPGFLDALEQLLADVHARGVAYVDLEKVENILVGDDGHPWLIDFQISLASPGWLVRRFQREDVRHLLKHRKRLAPDTLSSGQAEAVKRRSRGLEIHRLLTRPYFRARRAWQAHRDRFCKRCRSRLLPGESDAALPTFRCPSCGTRWQKPEGRRLEEIPPEAIEPAADFNLRHPDG